MSEFFTKNKNWFFPVILCLIYFTFVILTWGKWGNVLSDSFREVVLPQAVLDGKIFYSEILNLYPPLAYYLNALLYKIFGNSLNVLYVAGIVNSLIIFASIFWIIKDKSSDFLAFLTTFSVMSIFAFRITVSNFGSWIFPYSYAFIYAFSSCLLAFVAYLLFKKNNQFKYLYLSFFFSGLSLAFKADFLLFALVPLTALIKCKSVKHFFISLILFLIPISFTYMIFFMTGGEIADLKNQIQFLADFAKAPSVIVFNQVSLPQHISPFTINFVISSLFEFGWQFILISIFACSCLFVSNKFNNKAVIALSTTVLSLFFIASLIYISLAHYMNSHLFSNFVFVPYLVLISAILLFVLKIKDKNFTEKDKFYFLIVITAFLLSIRQFACVFISYIGNFSIIVYWTAFIYLLFEILPENINFFQKPAVKKVLTFFLFSFSVSFIIIYSYFAIHTNYKIASEKGCIYTTQDYANPLKETISFAKANVKNGETLVVMDEGLIVNYFADIPSNLKYYALIPHIIDTVGEDNIIAALEADKPDYIFVTNNIYPTNLGGMFGQHYARKIYGFIQDNYTQQKIIQDEKLIKSLRVTVFKIK